MSSPDKTRKQLRSKFKTLTSWYNELREKHVFLAQQPDEHLTDAHLTHLEIQLSSLDFETGQVSSTIPHFFLPATQERIENTWNAGSDGASIQDHHFSSSGFCQDYSWGCNLMREVAGHHWTLARCHSEPWAPIGYAELLYIGICTNTSSKASPRARHGRTNRATDNILSVVSLISMGSASPIAYSISRQTASEMIASSRPPK
ncbi:hypothetical protein AWENTII_007882 [Aspergillus wentii]